MMSGAYGEQPTIINKRVNRILDGNGHQKPPGWGDKKQTMISAIILGLAVGVASDVGCVPMKKQLLWPRLGAPIVKRLSWDVGDIF